tara:strand:- start:737 stop:919 length:183 start_codon:yes stop_codon:yes gene_type:complete
MGREKEKDIWGERKRKIYGERESERQTVRDDQRDHGIIAAHLSIYSCITIVIYKCIYLCK